MGRNKAMGPDEIPIEAWRLGEVIPIYKNKGDAQTCSNYRGIKILRYITHMKLWERVIERRLQRETEVSENQFGFMPGRSTMEAIHIIRSLMEKYRERQKDLHLAFLDLEKAYDSLTKGIQESIPWCLIFADDIVLISETLEGLNGRLEQWRKALEDNGLRVSREKTNYYDCKFQ
ncbi:retrovirus-related pol polyprotein LINE-1 [Tanacetum coccineum]